MLAVQVRVALGAEWLDGAMPGWWKQIDLNRLDVGAPCRCVLGQLVLQILRDDDRAALEGYYLAIEQSDVGLWLGTSKTLRSELRARGLTLTLAESIARGFHDLDGGEAYGELTDAWRELIMGRRAKRPVRELEFAR